jgi:hypothetical protein
MLQWRSATQRRLKDVTVAEDAAIVVSHQDPVNTSTNLGRIAGFAGGSEKGRDRSSLGTGQRADRVEE